MSTSSQLAVVIVAGGKGLRLGADVPKQFLPLAEKPMLMRTIEKFFAFDNQMQIVVVLHKDYFIYWKELCVKNDFNISCELVEGGSTRFESVKKGLAKIPDYKIVAIHDAARPLVTKTLIEQCYHYAEVNQCGIVPVVDEKNSLRQIKGTLHEPLDRTHIKIVQTPQTFPAHLIKEAYKTDYTSHFTDDATVAESHGVTVQLIEGEDSNIKITTSIDMDFASFLLNGNNCII